MSDTNTSNHVAVKVPRNALFAVGGVLLVGVGLAAGMLLRTPTHNEAAADSQQAALMASAPGAGVTSTPNSAQPEGSSKANTTRHERQHRDTTVASANPRATSGSPDIETRPAVVCPNCGVIEAVRPIQQKGQGSGLGAVAGGVLGGVVGNQVGKGSGNAAMTVLGAIGGGYAGNEVEKRTRTVTVYEARVRMDDGSVRTFTQKTEPVPGTRVEVDSRGFHAIGASNDNDAPRTVRTSDGT